MGRGTEKPWDREIEKYKQRQGERKEGRGKRGRKRGSSAECDPPEVTYGCACIRGLNGVYVYVCVRVRFCVCV